MLQKKKRKDEEMMQEGTTKRERRKAMGDAVLPDTNEMNTKTRTNSCNSRREEKMAKRGLRNKVITMMVAFAVAFTFMPMNSVNTYAASKAKKPSKPAITSMSVESSTITVKWKKAKNAKQYQVALKTYPKGWKYVKKVKKTKKNKKAYTKKGKYKVVKAKKGKYKVYRYQTIVKYKTLKGKTKSTKYSYKAPKRGTKYTLAVRALNGKKKSAWTSKSAATWNKDTLRIDGKKHTHKWEAEYKTVDEHVKVKEQVQTGTKDVEKKTGVKLVCDTCGKTLDEIDNPDASYTEDQINELVSKHRDEDSCTCESTKAEDVTETVTEPVYEEQEVDKVVSKKVKTGYTCSCHARKDLSGKVTLHQHQWKTRQKTKTGYKTVTYKKKYIECLDCNKKFINHYTDSNGNIHDYVESGNPEHWEMSNPEATAHTDWELDNNGTGSSRNVEEFYKTEKVKYDIPYNETYCDICGYIK